MINEFNDMNNDILKEIPGYSDIASPVLDKTFFHSQLDAFSVTNALWNLHVKIDLHLDKAKIANIDKQFKMIKQDIDKLNNEMK